MKKTTVTKTTISMLAMFALCMAMPKQSKSQKNETGVFIAPSVGISDKYEWNFEFEVGSNITHSLFLSVPASVYYAKNSGQDRQPHGYLGLRFSYLFYTTDLTAIAPLVSGYKHWTGERSRNTSFDYDAGVRFYKFVAKPGARAAAFTFTFRYLNTQGNTFDKNGASSLIPREKYILSLGFSGLF